MHVTYTMNFQRNKAMLTQSTLGNMRGPGHPGCWYKFAWAGQQEVQTTLQNDLQHAVVQA